MFYDNLKKACENKGLKVTPYAQSLGLTSGIVGNWKKGGTPRIDILIKMSSDLGVSIDYLLTGRKYKQISATEIGDGQNKELLDLLEKLTEEQRQMFILQIKGVLSDK